MRKTRGPKLKETYLFGVTAQGTTITEAKENAGKTIYNIVQADAQGSVIVIVRAWIALLYPCRGSWHYTYIQTPTHPMKAGNVCGGSGGSMRHDVDRLEALGRVTISLAQAAWSTDEPDDDAYIAEVFPHAHPVTYGGRLAAELRTWIGHQRTYKKAIDAGHSDNEAHHIAGGLKHLVKPKEAA